ncbi:coproporphyrinogen III oxidase [Clostridia bacterium]|nr:coproporphyrinogen III oxidase [Clostridia bacterium]
MNSLGIYVHIPFCRSKCGYCDFYSVKGSEDGMDSYQKALLSHIKECGRYTKGFKTDTIYIGGGTPTYYGVKRLCALLDRITKSFDMAANMEITVEANPDSINEKELRRLKKSGVNRLSLGIQSADDGELAQLGRIHTYSDALAAFSAARSAGFDNISVDLMYGLHNQTREGWKNTLEQILLLAPEHISCYGLKLGENCGMSSEPTPVNLPCDDIQADMYLDMVELLDNSGYNQYEISNFALPSRESRHNLKYWNLDEYIGFGAAAHSDFARKRYSNVADIDGYIKGIIENDAIIDHMEQIDPLERAVEYLMLRLRTSAGISSNEYCRTFRATFAPIEDTLVEAESRGYALHEGDRWRLTPRGFLISNRIIASVLDGVSSSSQS